MAHGNKVNAAREYFVCKSNELIQKGRYNLSTQQQKIVLYAISKVKKGDDPRKLYELSIEDICSVCGMNIDNGGFYYQALKQDMRKLASPVWVQYPDKSEWLVSWFDDVGIVPLSGTVYVRFHERIWEHIFDLKERYTQYHLSEVLVFNGKYAIRLFEILRSHFTQAELDTGTEKEIVISLEHLRDQLCITAYPEWKEFNRNVMKKAIDEINEYSEQMHVEYETIKTGRRITDVKFIVYPPELGERIRRYRNSNERLR
jgi:plasmid replication initiation protein